MPGPVAVVGRGRAGAALSTALLAAGLEVEGPLGRSEETDAPTVLLCVPDSEIAAAAEVVARTRAARFVGHVSGATPLAALEPARRAGAELFSLHPLQTFSGAVEPSLAGVGAAVAGSAPAGVAVARALAERLGMRPFELEDTRRASYHAAASMASNFLVTLEAAAEAMAANAGFSAADARAALGPLVRQTVENWATAGPQAALTGPVARGDERTVSAQRAAVAAAEPALLPLFDALVERTRALAGEAANRTEAVVAPLRPIRTVADLRARLANAPRPIALVPTMGALHDGHLALIRRAREQAATVVVSIFVNPTQFAPGEDLGAYPRDEPRDLALAQDAGADLVFAPPPGEVYPPGFDTAIEVGELTAGLEGDPAHRGSEHFRGVATVVAKLFNMVRPEVALFGQKDAQQALVIRKLVRDLDFGVRIEVAPTVRDPDGLALSSRNAYLNAAEREHALALSRSLRAAEALVADGQIDAERVLDAARAELEEADVEAEYLELRSADDLSPADRVGEATLLCVAAGVGPARLIDNVVLRAPAEATLQTRPRTGAAT